MCRYLFWLDVLFCEFFAYSIQTNNTDVDTSVFFVTLRFLLLAALTTEQHVLVFHSIRPNCGVNYAYRM